MDFGYPQITQTEKIKGFLVNEPVPVEAAKQFIGGIAANIIKPNTISSNATIAPISIKDKDKKKENKIFVDIIENITILFNSTGYVINSSIEGMIQMKSYLFGNPDLKLALNDDLVLGKGSSSAVTIDDYNFHENVTVNEFEMNKSMRIRPPEGEFVVMNYRVTGDFNPPFRIFPIIDEPTNYRLEMTLRIKAVFPKEYAAGNMNIKFAVPRQTSSVHTELQKGVQGQTAEFVTSDNGVVWNIKKFNGNQEFTLKTKITLQTGQNASLARKELGPVRLEFTIPMYNASTLSIKNLKVEDNSSKNDNPPQRWVRYITQSKSYVCRL